MLPDILGEMFQNKKTKQASFSWLSVIVLLLFAASPQLINFKRASAAVVPFAMASVRYDRLKAVTNTGGRVCFKPSTTNASQTVASVKVTFPTTSGTDYVVSTTVANWATDTTQLDAGQTALPAINNAGITVSGKAVTFPLTTPAVLSSATLYCFNFGRTTLPLTTSSAGATETIQGTVATQTSAPALIDSTTFAQSIISDDSVVVSAVVPPSFTFVLSGNTDAFTSNLSTTSVVSTSGRTVQITTNAYSGWVVWVKDLNNSGSSGALKSATAGNYMINGTTAPGAASHTLTPGGEDYGLGVTVNTDAAGGGTVSVNPAYDGTANKAGSLDPTQFRPVASASGTANGDIINLNERATIASMTPAASDYTDTMTVVGAGQF